MRKLILASGSPRRRELQMASFSHSATLWLFFFSWELFSWFSVQLIKNAL